MAADEHEQLSRQTGMVLRTAVQVAMQVAEALARPRRANPAHRRPPRLRHDHEP